MILMLLFLMTKDPVLSTVSARERELLLPVSDVHFSQTWVYSGKPHYIQTSKDALSAQEGPLVSAVL